MQHFNPVVKKAVSKLNLTGELSMNFNAKDAKGIAKERKEGLSSATFAKSSASFAFQKYSHPDSGPSFDTGSKNGWASNPSGKPSEDG